MKDTIGNRLRQALRAEKDAEQCRQIESESLDYPPARRRWSIMAAKYEAIAAGHAFRAAELAYDAGRSGR